MIVGVLSSVALVVGVVLTHRHRMTATLLTVTIVPMLAVGFGTTAGAAIVPTVSLGTAANFSVLAGSTVTNTGPTTLQRNLGLSPGSSVTGFPPGTVIPPATMEVANAVAVQAQSDLTTAYNDAASRPLNATTGADLAGLTLQGGAYGSTTTKGPLLLTGTLTLDGANNASSVFIFETNSTLTTGSAATVQLINGASACNVFWQIGSSATLGTGTTFVGNILALTSITLQDSVQVNGRALARNGAVTMINDGFTGPDCTPAPTTTTTMPATTTTMAGTSTTLPPTTTTMPATTTTVTGTSTTLAATTTTVAGSTTTTPTSVAPTTLPGVTTTQPGATTTQPGATTTTPLAPTTSPAALTTTTAPGHLAMVPTSTTAPVLTGRVTTETTATTATTVLVELPRTGRSVGTPLLLAALCFSTGAIALELAARLRTRSA